MSRYFRISTRNPLRLPDRSTGQKWLAALTIAAIATTIAMAWRHTAVLSIPLGHLDDLLYDSVYRARPLEDRRDGPVVIVAVDDESLTLLNKGLIGDTPYGWPWPRQFWGSLIPYFERAGARAVVIDLLFIERSVYSPFDEDDQKLADAIDAAHIPVVLATLASDDGKPAPFAPPAKNPLFGASNVVRNDNAVLRTYDPIAKGGMPSVGLAAARAFNSAISPASGHPFLMHYYGPHQEAGGRRTHRFLSAAKMIAAANGAKVEGIDPALFKDKLVFIGALSAGLYDLKATPLSGAYPGVEYHATATENLLEGRRVLAVPLLGQIAITLAATTLAAVGVTLPRGAGKKLLAALVVLVMLFLLGVSLFRGQQIRWLPLAAPLVALIFATVLAFAWSYLVEDRERRMLLRTLEQTLSPAVAAELRRDPSKLKLGGERREMTVMFTDVAGFTTISETLDPQQLADLMNYYLEEMSAVVFDVNGTLDKYIGDAIMSFWNAPLDQAEHATLACRAALRMQRREMEMQPKLRELGAGKLYTRIGINSGPMAVGNLGSSFKTAYTVLGDAVNLASRLEGGNKLYNSRILLAQTTADLVRGKFVMRQLDVLQVKGRVKPMPVYELLADGKADPVLAERVGMYETAFQHYLARRWDEATAELDRLLAAHPDDAPASALLTRVSEYRADPPPPDWDGSYAAKEK